MHWKKWLRTAMLNEIRLINWPVEVKPPGPKFDLKALSTVALRMLVTEYIEHKLNGGPLTLTPRLERWTAGVSRVAFFPPSQSDCLLFPEEKAIPKDSLEKGSIPLVVSIQGVPLRTLSHCKEWREQFEKARKARKTRLMAGGLVTRHDDSDHDRGDADITSHHPSPVRKHVKQAKPARYTEVIDHSDADSVSHHQSPVRKHVKQAKPARYIEVTDHSDADSDSRRPDMSRARSQKAKHQPGRAHVKKRARYLSDSAPETRPRKRAKESQVMEAESDDSDMAVRHNKDKKRGKGSRADHHRTQNRDLHVARTSKHSHTRPVENKDMPRKGKEKAIEVRLKHRHQHAADEESTSEEESSGSDTNSEDSEDENSGF
jgi:hypothetical protein